MRESHPCLASLSLCRCACISVHHSYHLILVSIANFVHRSIPPMWMWKTRCWAGLGGRIPPCAPRQSMRSTSPSDPIPSPHLACLLPHLPQRTPPPGHPPTTPVPRGRPKRVFSLPVVWGSEGLSEWLSGTADGGAGRIRRRCKRRWRRQPPHEADAHVDCARQGDVRGRARIKVRGGWRRGPSVG